jgi:hypothetical protein
MVNSAAMNFGHDCHSCVTLKTMSVQLFQSFSEMIDKIPAKGVLTAVELERQMLQNDLVAKRTLPFKAVQSILAFCNFLKNTVSGVHSVSTVLPLQHISFYRKTIERLVQAGELPVEAGKLFDETFSAAFLKATAY